eukprot:5031697-Prymnesium_polylepis.1
MSAASRIPHVRGVESRAAHRVGLLLEQCRGDGGGLVVGVTVAQLGGDLASDLRRSHRGHM